MFDVITRILLEIWNRILVAFACIILLIEGMISPKRFLQAIKTAGNGIKNKGVEK